MASRPHEACGWANSQIYRLRYYSVSVEPAFALKKPDLQEIRCANSVSGRSQSSGNHSRDPAWRSGRCFTIPEKPRSMPPFIPAGVAILIQPSGCTAGARQGPSNEDRLVSTQRELKVAMPVKVSWR